MLAMFAFLLTLQLKKYSGGSHRCCIVSFTKVKTWCYICAMTLLALFLVDQVFTPFSINWIVYTIMWASIATVRQLAALTVFHFFSKRAKKLIAQEQKSKMLTLEKTILAISLVCFLILLICVGVQISTVRSFAKGTD